MLPLGARFLNLAANFVCIPRERLSTRPTPEGGAFFSFEKEKNQKKAQIEHEGDDARGSQGKRNFGSFSLAQLRQLGPAGQEGITFLY